jgi:hypothetical protein
MRGRRFALCFSWSRSREGGAPLGVLENRYPALFEFRRTVWPNYEWTSDPVRYRQDVAGFLDHVILFDFKRFIDVIECRTGTRVRVLEREQENTRRFLLDDRLLNDVDTLVVVSLDHVRTSQQASGEEVEAVNAFLARDGSCLVVSPHHDIGVCGPGLSSQRAERAYHGDSLVPAEQRIGGFARSLLSGLGLPIENQFGLRPAGNAADASRPAPLHCVPDLDRLQLLAGVDTFNLHPHLPHLFVPESLAGHALVLAKQSLSLQTQPGADVHPFVAAGNRVFNSLVWAPPRAKRAGHVLVCDATLWSAAFGGLASLERFWTNLADMS